MPNPSTPAATNLQTLPPVINLPFVQPGTGILTPTGLQVLQALYALLSGGGGIIDLIATVSGPGVTGAQVESAIAQDVRAQALLPAGQIATLAGVVAGLGLPLAPIDYRETSSSPVTWLPVLAGSGTAGVQTYTTQAGLYAELGPVSIATFDIALSAFDAATAGSLTITGLPHNSNDALKASGSLSAWGDATLTAAYSELGLVAAPGSAVLSLVQSGSGQPVLDLPAAGGSASLTLTGVATYFR